MSPPHLPVTKVLTPMWLFLLGLILSPAYRASRVMGKDPLSRNPSIPSPSSSTLPKDDCHLSKGDLGPQGAGLWGSCKPAFTRVPQR